MHTPGTRKSANLWLPVHTHNELKKAAAERGLSLNNLAVRAIEDYLTRLIPADEFKLTR